MSKSQGTAQLINKASIEVDSIASLITVEVWDGRKVDLSGFYAGTPWGFKRQFTYDASQAKTGHDGWSVINPDHLSTIGSANWYTAGGDSTPTGSNGCWVRDVEGWVNVLEAGAKGDSSNNDSTAFEAAQSQTRTLFVPEGHYLINTVLNNTSIIGANRFTTFLESYTATGWVLTLDKDTNWQRTTIKQLFFRGIDGSNTKNGIRFGNDPEVAGDEFIGRYEITECTFDNLDKCIFKQYGNIGNLIHNNAFEVCNYHYYAVDHSNMHMGNDIFTANHFRGADKASIYISGGFGGQTIFDGNIQEENPGFCVFIDGYLRGAGAEPLEFRNHWTEKNATAVSDIDIGGTLYTPKEWYFKDTDLALMEGIRMNVAFELINSTVRIKSAGSNDTGFSLTKDATSSFIIENFESRRFQNVGVFAERLNPTTDFNTDWAFVSTYHRNKVTRAYSDNLMLSETFNDADTYFFSGSTNVTGTRVRDGVLFDSAVELETVDSVSNILTDNFTMANGGNYIVVTFSLKKVSGIDGGLRIPAFIDPVPVASSEWTTLIAIGKPASIGQPLRTEAKAGGTTVMRVADVQGLEFTTLQEALQFANSRLYQLPTTYNSVVYGDSAPTNGTWVQGDIVYNTAAAASGNIGWVCVTAGSPGTWKTFGDISA